MVIETSKGRQAEGRTNQTKHIHAKDAPSKRLWGKERWEFTSRMFWPWPGPSPISPEEEDDKSAWRSTSSPTRDPHRLSVVPLDMCVVCGVCGRV